MEIVEWQQPQRTISQHDVDDFYERPLPEITVFRFQTADLQMPEHHGAFSLKSVRQGREVYFFNGRSVSLSSDQVLLVNADERYGSEISDPAESLSVFFREHELRVALRSLESTVECQLEAGDALSRPGAADEVAQIALSGDEKVLSELRRLHGALDAEEEQEATEAAMLLLLAALIQNRSLAPPTALESLKKRSTRDELISRILKARHYLEATAGSDMNLDSLAELACLSRYHFLRVFTEVVGQTPVAFARSQRLQSACKSLSSGADFTSVVRASGYASESSFIRAYKREFSVPPPSARN